MTPEISSMVEHLFRTESGKLSSSLARAFGLRNLADIEDIVQDALEAAMVSWSFRGIPEYPTAWLHRVAKNKASDMLRRRSFEKKLFLSLDSTFHEPSYWFDVEKITLPGEIEDSQLRMMFACAHPGIPIESQIALTLKTLCGFSVREIASAFLTQEATIEKRLGRARKYFRDHHVLLDAPRGGALVERRDAVLTSLYLLFNEGYKRTESEGLLDRDLCLEALRLALLIAHNEATSSPEALALVALMSLLAARFNTRTNDEGAIILLIEQDRSKWNAELIARGMDFLARSEPDVYATSYHLEAAIQSLHAAAPSYKETNWPAILGLYKRLYLLKPSPIVAMHMSVAIAEVHGPEEAIRMLKAAPLDNHYLYHAILGDAEMKAGMGTVAKQSFRRSIELTRNVREKALLERRLEEASS